MAIVNSLRRIFSELTIAQRAGVAAAGIVVLLAAVAFVSWVSTPSYTVLYSNIDETQLAQVIDALEADSVPYKLEAGGRRVLVPRNQVYKVRASLASSGIQGAVVPKGYELLDEQGLSVSDFRQRVDYQRALEGELARTLGALETVRSATVRLVIPEEALFAENQKPVQASVLIDPAGPVSQGDVDAITFLVASSVEGLEPDQVTVATTDGEVLAAAGVDGSPGVGNSQLRMTREFETTVAGDVQAMLASLLGPGRSSVVVRAVLNFDEKTVEAETYTPESATPLREQLIDETMTGAGAAPVGTVGVDGSPLPTDGDGSYEYRRNEQTREYGIDRVVTRSVQAPGSIERLSVAVVVDDGSLTGSPAPDTAEIENLVAAAIGLDPARGDTIEVSAAAFPAPAGDITDPQATDAQSSSVMDLIPNVAGALVLLLVGLALFLQSRGGKHEVQVAAWSPDALPGGDQNDLALDDMATDVLALVDRQPEEIATLLRSWLADNRETVRS